MQNEHCNNSSDEPFSSFNSHFLPPSCTDDDNGCSAILLLDSDPRFSRVVGFGGWLRSSMLPSCGPMSSEEAGLGGGPCVTAVEVGSTE